MNFKENESAQKLRGGYYTDPLIATFLLKWVLNKRPTSILEPSCGDGVFFNCLQNLELGDLQEIYGFEIEPFELEKAKNQVHKLIGVKSSLNNQDFLEWFLSNPTMPRFDAAIGNPPFIRYQYLEKRQQLLAKEIFKLFDLKFTMHTNAWVPFVIACISLLKPGGRFAFVLPEELLHILHAESLRKFLASQCSKIMIVDPQELWFENTLQGAILVMAEKKEDWGKKSKGVGIVQTKSRDFLLNDPEEIFQNLNFQNGKVLSGKWMTAYLNQVEKEAYFELSESKGVYKFNEIAEVAVGIVTGANRFFLVPDSVVNAYDLKKYSYPMFGRSEHVKNLIFNAESLERNRKKNLPTNFIWFKEDDNFSSLPKRVQEYIIFGEQEGYHKRYKCRIREPWYCVPSVYSTSLGMLKRSHDFPKLIFNDVQAYSTDTSYRIKPVKFDAYSMVSSFINSLTVLSAELEGRHYGGGVLELVPSEIRKLVIPIRPSSKKELIYLDDIYQNSATPEEFLEYQDKRIFSHLGIDAKKYTLLRNAWLKLRNRRIRAD